MSVHVSSWAWKQQVGDGLAKLVLLKLADQANDAGECWPSHKKLATECEMGVATVKRKLDALVEHGLVTIEHRRRETGGKTSNLYRLPIAQAELSHSSLVSQGDSSAVSYQEPSLEPSKNRGAAPEPRNNQARHLCPEAGCSMAFFHADDLLAHLEVDHGRERVASG